MAIVAALIASLATNKNLDYGVITRNLTAGPVLRGLLTTFVMSIVGMVIGLVLGTLVALARMSSNRVLQAVAFAYIWFFRGVPLLVQLLVWGNLGLLFATLSLRIPFTQIVLVEANTNKVVTATVAACLGLGLHEAAYMAEIVRGGILAVDVGQGEAATALGMTSSLAMRRIVLPQALRVIIPPTGNQFISLLKASSLVSVIAGGDLLTAVENISAVNYRTMELLAVASFWYLVIVSVLSIGQHFLERRLSRGHQR
ncbi:amino acid ABC transporter permease [Calidifontibacter sp. DB0510]|uniref:Amino acid ABC transporter permease n=2 Tax=Metallococcus carri TaxID=1656884 RepID=A0A967B022_9MICO|nr:amino acid ABC transporter permease [Metallococcus carri]NOP37105.1 amino acid ABC transporter permease [Calidifontibacter sp. DB2511S]